MLGWRQRVLSAEDAALAQRIRSGMKAATGHTAPRTDRRHSGAAHVPGRVRAAELLPVSQRCGVRVRRSAENATAHSVLRKSGALDARELIRLVVLTERAAAPERRRVHVRLPARDAARLPSLRDALALRRASQAGRGGGGNGNERVCWSLGHAMFASLRRVHTSDLFCCDWGVAFLWPLYGKPTLLHVERLSHPFALCVPARRMRERQRVQEHASRRAAKAATHEQLSRMLHTCRAAGILTPRPTPDDRGGCGASGGGGGARGCFWRHFSRRRSAFAWHNCTCARSSAQHGRCPQRNGATAGASSIMMGPSYTTSCVSGRMAV